MPPVERGPFPEPGQGQRTPKLGTPRVPAHRPIGMHHPRLSSGAACDLLRSVRFRKPGTGVEVSAFVVVLAPPEPGDGAPPLTFGRVPNRPSAAPAGRAPPVASDP